MTMLAPLLLASLIAVGTAGTTRDASSNRSTVGPATPASGPLPCRAGGIAAHTERVSVAGVDEQTKKPVLRASLSADGRFVAFSSGASALVPRDHNGHVDVFVRDLRRRRTTRVSVSSTGAEGDGASFYPSISADGRFVAFRSFARNLVPHDRNRVEDVFVRDRLTNVTRRVSVDTSGREANGPSVSSSINGDGSVVVFSSDASNLVGNDRNGVMDVFVRDRRRRRTIRVSVGWHGEADGRSEGSGVSRDGRNVVFRSLATNLARADTNRFPDVFVRNWVAGTTSRVDLSSAGAEANHETYRGSLSGDGRRVAFRSEASNLVPHDRNGAQDVFVYDRPTKTMRRISVSTRGVEAYAPPSRRTARGHRFMTRAFLSQTGRFAAFGSFAANLVRADTNRAEDVFVRDLELRRTVRVSVGPGGTQSDGGSTVMGISADGSVVLFVSSADNLVRGDTNGLLDAFVRVRRTCPLP
jgi:Tol biopolymer transport system component